MHFAKNVKEPFRNRLFKPTIRLFKSNSVLKYRQYFLFRLYTDKTLETFKLFIVSKVLSLYICAEIKELQNVMATLVVN